MTLLKRSFISVVLVALAVLLTGPVANAEQDGEYCTQGAFAQLLCESGKLDPRTEWTEDSALAKLGDELGIEPLDGWD